MVAKDGDHTFFDIRMKASMKNTLYKVLVVLDSSGNVSNAACSCPAGSGLGGFGNCNHVGGVLFALEDFNRKGLHQSTEPISCTSKLSAWNVPSSSVAPASIDEIVLQKIKFGADNVQRYKPRYNPFDPRLPNQRVLTQNIEQLTLNLAKHAPNSCFFAFHDMPKSTLDSADSLPIAVSEVPSLSSPFQGSSVELVCHEHSEESMAFNDCYDISSPNFKEMIDLYFKSMHSMTKEEIDLIQHLTVGQSSNENWLKYRMYILTDSNFYSAAVNRVEPSSKLNSMFYSRFSSLSVEHGRYYEPHVRNLYFQALNERGFKDIIVDDVGLLIYSKNSFLGASLDGIVQCNQDTWGLEIKCPYSKYNSTLSSALTDKKFFLKKNDTIELKRSHPYYYQIQGQIYCSGLKRVDLAVWFGDSEPLCIVTIHYDEKFMEKDVLPRLEYFYVRAVLPELFTKRVKRGYRLYLHGGWS